MSAPQVCQLRQSSTQLFRCSLPRAALWCPGIPRAIALSSEQLLCLPEPSRELTLVGCHAIAARLPSGPQLGSLKLPPACLHNAHTVLKTFTASPTIENNTGNNQQMAQPPLANCIQLRKLRDPAEREDMEKHSACYEMPRQFRLKRDREATALEKGLSLE